MDLNMNFEKGFKVGYTFDAGCNPFLIYHKSEENKILNEIENLKEINVQEIIKSNIKI